MVRNSSLLLTLAFLVGLHEQARADILGTARSFAVLGGSAVTNTGPSIVSGNLGVWPGSAVTGFPPGVVVGGTIHITDAVAMQAQNDVTTAYNALAGMASTQTLTGQDLGGLTLVPGVYFFASSAQLTGTLTLDTQGNPDALFVFQIGTTLTTASNSSVITINGNNDCHVYWQVGSSATLGTGTNFQGNILALASITLTTGANIVDGRALARNGAVTLDTIHVVAGCSCIPSSPSDDCNNNGVADECDLADGTSHDCNHNGIPDECDIASGTSHDCNQNGIPDECDLSSTLPGFVTCDVSPMASVGVTISFQVCAHGGGAGDPVTLTNPSGLPAGATLSPPLPLTDDSVCTTFMWTPTSGQVGAPVLIFIATDHHGCTAECKMRILVAQTILLLGPAYGSSQYTIFGHLYDTQLTQVRRAFPVSAQHSPTFSYNALPQDYSVQVVMYSPLLFQQNPSQWSYAMEFTKDVATQSMNSSDHGTMNGIDVSVHTSVDTNGHVHVNFPYHVHGM